MERYVWEPGNWQVTVDEVSAGVYEIIATSPIAGEIRMVTTEPDMALQKARKEANDRVPDSSPSE